MEKQEDIFLKQFELFMTAKENQNHAKETQNQIIDAGSDTDTYISGMDSEDENLDSSGFYEDDFLSDLDEDPKEEDFTVLDLTLPENKPHSLDVEATSHGKSNCLKPQLEEKEEVCPEPPSIFYKETDSDDEKIGNQEPPFYYDPSQSDEEICDQEPPDFYDSSLSDEEIRDQEPPDFYDSSLSDEEICDQEPPLYYLL